MTDHQLELPGLILAPPDRRRQPAGPRIQIMDWTVPNRCACRWREQDVTFVCGAPAAFAVQGQPVCADCLRELLGWV